MKNIVITQPVGLTDSQLADLKTLGNVTYYDTVSKNADEWLERVKGADVIFTNSHGFDEGWKVVENVFITLPFVGVGFLDIDLLKKHNVLVSRSPGCNQVAVSEWIVAMMLNYARRLPEFTRIQHFDEPTPIYTQSLYDKTACILGKGFIGSRTGKVLEALGMKVTYYTRNDDLAACLKDADFIVDCLSLNPSTVGFYNAEFFEKVKDGAVFVTISSNKLKDHEVILNSLESGKLKHLITDNASGLIFDAGDADYRALLNNPKVTVTPHVAAYTDNTAKTASEICVDNIKAYLAGKPINTVYVLPARLDVEGAPARVIAEEK